MEISKLWNLTWVKLSYESMSLYKGIAILMIVIHNFMHWLPGAEEMEFKYEDTYFLNFIQSVGEQPERLFQFTMSFLGHFGVQVFIFLSAYGLTKKYLIKTPTYKEFVYKRFASIYPSFILAIIFWAVISADYKYGLLSPVKLIYWNIESLFYKVTLLSNFIPEERLALVGPWWFISFIFQFYLVFPFLFKFTSKWGNKGILLLALSSILLMVSTKGTIGNVSLSYTVLGHLPELCVGMYLALNDKRQLRISSLVVLIAFITFLLGNIIEQVWYLTHVSFLILLLTIFSYGVPRLTKISFLTRFTLFISSISMHLFLVNGFLRKPFVQYAIEGNTWLYALLFGVLSLSISIFVAFILSKCEVICRRSASFIK